MKQKYRFFESIKKREPAINKREEDGVRPKMGSLWLVSFVTFLTCWQYPNVLLTLKIAYKFKI